MGKKSRKQKQTNNAASNQIQPQAVASSAPIAQQYPHSDGPSEEELSCLQTESQTLQMKLDQLTTLSHNNDRKQFVSQFVPLDLTQEDMDGYLHDLTLAPEAEGHWFNLIVEIEAIARGKGVTKIEGDQKSRAIFHFEHPTLKGCDREVSFTCVGGEWRAEG
mmetsp:Transcript_17989/g.22022  ORF Transcript_17989/g.22022 Transcript_17989/m.22022 type:complete len:162 (-) Transcript_17989:874-1359(-)